MYAGQMLLKIRAIGPPSLSGSLNCTVEQSLIKQPCYQPDVCKLHYLQSRLHECAVSFDRNDVLKIQVANVNDHQRLIAWLAIPQSVHQQMSCRARVYAIDHLHRVLGPS